jgi:multiple sugar transport system permease protein
MKGSSLYRKVLLYIISVIVTVIVAFPFVWILLTSLKTYPEIYTYPITYVPKKLTFEHYFNVFKTHHLERYMLHSLKVSLLTVASTLLISIFPAYALARLNFPRRKILVSTVVFCVVLPQIVLVIPFLQMLKSLQLVNKHAGLILVYLAITTPVAIWFLIGFFEGIPRSLEDAAMIDGCSRIQTLFKIILPIMRPGISAVAIYAFFLSWNEFMFALSYLSTADKLTLPVFLGRFVGQYQTRWGELFAGSVLSYLVPLIAFAVLQKHFVSALVKGAVKE